MTIPTLHIPQKDSPQTTLAVEINDTVTTLTLADSSIFEADGVTRLTLGIDQTNTEVITVSSYDGSNVITVIRGSPAYSWPIGTLIARVLNAEDIDDIHEYLTHLNGVLTGGALVTNGDSHDHASGDGNQIPEGGILDGANTIKKLGTAAVNADKFDNDSLNG